MENSAVLARIIGPILIIVAVGVLLNLRNYRKLLDEFPASTSLLYLGGLMSLVFGILIVQFHNVWKLDWPLIITILGWGGVVKGALIMVFPKAVSRLADPYKKHTGLVIGWVLVALAIGILLTVMGYREWVC